MITEEEYGCFVTPERVRADAATVERAGFALRYECPLDWLRVGVALRRLSEEGTETRYGVPRTYHLSDYSCNPPGPPRQT